MKKIYILLIYVVCSGVFNYMSAQTLTNYAKQRNQELAERQRMEHTNYEKACKTGTLSSYKEYLSMYPKGKYVQDVRKRIAELERKEEQAFYERMCLQETKQAYLEYIKKYPNGIYLEEAKGRIEDLSLWLEAKSDNTITAYNNYLENSRNKSFSQLANEAIAELESVEEWNKIRRSSSKSLIESFILKYPKSSYISSATKRHDELLAVEFYNQGNLQHAYDKFESAGGKYLIDTENRKKYDECAEFVEYNKLSSYSRENDLSTFLKNHPSGKYYNQVSNWLAIAKAKSLTAYSGSYQFDEAMLYAKDEETKHTVKKYIKQAKDLYKSYERRRKARARKVWWKKNLKFGVELLDFGLNNLSFSSDVAVYYNVGLCVRLGDFQSPVQFEIGIKPGFVAISYKKRVDDNSYRSSYNYEQQEDKFFSHMPLYARLKYNVLDDSSAKIYVAGLGAYNAVRNKDFENEYSVGGGIGYAIGNWDWFLIYYKQDIGTVKSKDGNFWGTSIGYYF